MQKISLNSHLRNAGTPDKLRHLIIDIATSVKYIVHALKTGDLGMAGTSNLYGENQLALDVLSNEIIKRHLNESYVVGSFASEEESKIVEIQHGEKKYAVVFDPLDGSSLVDVNQSVGSIFGIYDKNSFIGKTGKDQIAALFVVYGPRTTLVYSTKKGVHEFSLNDIGEFTLSIENIKLNDNHKIFSPGNLRAISENKKYLKLIENWGIQGKTLRYSGGMAPDINSILMKKQGVFTYPAHSKNPTGKLRLLYECNPFSFLITEAGGLAIDEQGNNILDIKIEKIEQTTPIFIGSKNAINTVKKHLISS